MKNDEITLTEAVGESGIISDGDWIESKDQDPSGTIRLVQLADIGDGRFLNKSRRFVNTETAERLRCTFLVPGDVLVARLPDPLGRACVFPDISQPAIAAVDVCIIRPDPTKVKCDWLVLFLNSPGIRSLIASYAQGATRARVPTGKLRLLPVKLPTIEAQTDIAARIIQQLNLVDSAKAAAVLQIEELKLLPQKLLARISEF